MITSEELAFVRLAMRRRLLSANTVREAVERKRWDAPDRSIPSILVDMGALDGDQATRLRRALRRAARRPKDTVVARPQVVDAAPAPPAEEESRLDPGVPARIGGYKLIRPLGAGAMGAVYVAEHQELRRTVALKLLMSEGAPSPRAVARFKREARLAARLDHPNIVRVYEAGVEEGQHFIAMDMVRGRSVAELIALGEVTPRRAVHIVRKVAEAVDYAHAQGVIHRDLKPANVLVDDASGEARVTDFGLATMSEPEEDDRLTRTGAAVGTPAYMAPEQVRGRLDEIDGRTDIYALGATLYEMLTGTPPFEASTFLELAKLICEEEPTAPRRRNPHVPPDVETICLKALEKDPKDRYQKASGMAADLAAFLDDAPIVAQPPSTFTVARRWAKRRPAFVAGFLGFLAVLLGATAWHFTRPGDLYVSTQPGGAIVYVDGVERGRTPADGGELHLRLPADDYGIEFGLEGHLPRAIGPERIRLGHGEVIRPSFTLVSVKGLLWVRSEPPGARVVVRRPGDPAPVASGTTDFPASLVQGQYEVEVVEAPPGYLLPAPRTAEVDPGGRETPVVFALEEDAAALHLSADPEDVTVRERGRTYAAPALLPGAGVHEVEVAKAGYLSRRLRIDVPPGARLRQRLTLTPLADFRRPLEGRLLQPDADLGGPHRRARTILPADVDADGRLDLLVLEEGRGGVHLVLLPGGANESLYRVPTAGRTLVDAADVDGDGVLDAFLGSGEHVEVRRGSDGALLVAYAGLDAYAVALHSPPDGRPRLLYLAEGGAGRDGTPRALEVDPRGPPARVAPAAERRTPPAIVVDRTGLGDRPPKAVFPIRDGLLVQPLDPKLPTFPPLKLPGATPGSAVIPVYVDRQGSGPWVAVVPERGPARLVEVPAGVTDLLRLRSYSLGEPRAELGAPLFVMGPRFPWLVLSEGARARVFRLGDAAAVEVPNEGLGARPVELIPGQVLWTRTGEAFALSEGVWRHAPGRSTDTELWIDADGEAQVADLDGDGAREVLAPSPDRRSVVALDPRPDRLRWRAPAPPAALDSVVAVPADLRGGPGGTRPDLLLAWGERLAGLSAADGRSLEGLPVPPAPVRAACASIPRRGARSDLYLLCEDDEGLLLVRYRWSDGAWQRTWAQRRASQGLEALPLDVDDDGENDLLVDGPMAVIRSRDGTELPWPTAREGDGSLEAGPRYLAGEVPLLVAPRGHVDGLPGLLARDARGTRLWDVPLGSGRQGDPAREVLAAPDLPLLVVRTARGVVALQRTDGVVLWSRDDPQVEAALLGGGPRPRLLLVRGEGELLALDPADGRPLWQRVLPAAGSGAASRPIHVPGAGGRPDAAALVAPSGALLYFALDDGRPLGELRSPDPVPLQPWLVALPAAEGPVLVLATGTGRLLAVEAAPGRLPEDPRVPRRDLLRRIALGGPFLEPALQELQALVADRPQDTALQVALARVHLERGDAAAALEVEAVREAPEARDPDPEALELWVRATYATRGFDAVEARLRDLARRDRALVGRAAIALGRHAEGEDSGRFFHIAAELLPHDAAARRLWGLHLLDAFERALSWNAAPPRQLAEARRKVAAARVELLAALGLAPDAEATAAALVATVLELRLSEALARADGGPDDPGNRVRRSLLESLVATLLGAGASPAREERHERVLALARALSTPQEAQLREAAQALTQLQPAWSEALDAIYNLRPRD